MVKGLLVTKSTLKMQKFAIMMALVFIISDCSAIASSVNAKELDDFEAKETHGEPILVEGLPPLMCGEELCDRPLRTDLRANLPASEDDGWWLSYGPDLDWNGMDDRLQRILAGQESISPTAIIGEDGKKTVAIIVDYAWHPRDVEIAELTSVLESHGWIGQENGAWLQTPESIDAVVIDKVPVSSLMDIYHLEGVVVIEMQNVMVPTNDIASKATRAMPSEAVSYTHLRAHETS